ncbi:hypothetical protein [uncultured Trichococcus sp.]|uniref:hypothetical protein n=1 Tax=uncultured Trichococcus sp. TaxID=189665 RepID=UPI0029C89258|nr:hypothetical protein [uncultured Trichococcus sp.]
MNKKNHRRRMLLAAGLIGLCSYPVATLSGRLLAESGSADRPVAAAQNSSSQTQATENQVSITLFPKKAGDQDDTERIQRAVDYCIENGKDLFFPSGTTYTIRSVDVEAGLRLVGYGAMFKLAERQPKFTRMFTTQNRLWESAEDSDYLIFEGITFDGNCWEQGAFLNYEKEQQFAILFSGSTEKAGMLRGKVIACRFQNWCGDGVHVYTNAEVAVSDSTSYNCFRGGVVASGSPSIIKITDFTAEKSQFGKAIDIEIDTEPHDKTELTIERLTAYESVDIGTQEGSVVRMTDSTVSGGTTQIYGFKNKVTIERSTLGNVEVMNATDCTFNEVTFAVTPSAAEDVKGVVVRVIDIFDELPKDAYQTTFNDCIFERADAGKLLETDKEVVAVNGYYGKLTLNDCVFREGFTTGYFNFGVAESYLKDVHFDTETAVSMQPLNWARIDKFVLDNVSYGESVTTPFRFLDYMITKPYATVIFKNMVLDSSKAGYAGADQIGTTKITSDRLILVDEDPTVADVPAFKGDTAKLYTPVAGSPSEWVAVTSDPIAADWKVVE